MAGLVTAMAGLSSAASRTGSHRAAFVPTLARLGRATAAGRCSQVGRARSAVLPGSFGGHARGLAGGARLDLDDVFSLRSSETDTMVENDGEEFDPGEIEGTDLRVLKYPHPKLRADDAEVDVFDDDLKKTIKELFMVMYACNGVGLAAPQVGINKRIMVFNPDGDPKKWPKEVALVNPKIVDTSSTTDVETEGCLSFPGMDGKVRRHKWVKVEAVNAMGKPIKKKYTGWEARVFQHEYDHLEGKVYIDRLIDDEDKERVQPVLDGLIEKYKAEYGDDYAL